MPADQRPHVRQDVRAVVGRREAADPAVEELHRLRAGGDLRVQVAGDRRATRRSSSACQAPGSVEHEALGRRQSSRAAALDEVRRERERRAREADQRHLRPQRRARARGPPRRRSRAPPASHSASRSTSRGACAPGGGSPGRRPSANSSPTPSGSSTSRMSAKMIAASTPSCSTAITVTSAAASGVLHSSRKPEPLADGAVLGHVAAGLAHEPDRRVRRSARDGRRPGTARHRHRGDSYAMAVEGMSITAVGMRGVPARARRATSATSGPILGGVARAAGARRAPPAPRSTPGRSRRRRCARARRASAPASGGDAEEVLDLTRAGEHRDVESACDQRRRGAFERAGILGQRPAVHRDAQHAEAARARSPARAAPAARRTPARRRARRSPGRRPSSTASASRQVCGGGTDRAPATPSSRSAASGFGPRATIGTRASAASRRGAASPASAASARVPTPVSRTTAPTSPRSRRSTQLAGGRALRQARLAQRGALVTSAPWRANSVASSSRAAPRRPPGGCPASAPDAMRPHTAWPVHGLSTRVRQRPAIC